MLKLHYVAQCAFRGFFAFRLVAAWPNLVDFSPKLAAPEPILIDVGQTRSASCPSTREDIQSQGSLSARAQAMGCLNEAESMTMFFRICGGVCPGACFRSCPLGVFSAERGGLGLVLLPLLTLPQLNGELVERLFHLASLIHVLSTSSLEFFLEFNARVVTL